MNRRHNLNRLAYFVAVIEEGTITGAAMRLGISKAVVSKQLLTLEEEIGASLIIRNSRHLVPSEIGREFYTRAKVIIEQAREAFDEVTRGMAEPKGLIRITATVDYGIMHVVPMAAEFSRQFPKVKIDFTLSDERLDPVGQGFDLAFRVGWLDDSSNLARKIGDFHEVAVCAPHCAFLPYITSPGDLAKWPFIGNKAVANQSKLTFEKQDKHEKVVTISSIEMDVSLAILSALFAGGGYAVLPDFVVRDDLRLGKLVHILPEWSLRSGGIYAVFPPAKFRNLAVQKFVDMLTDYHKSHFG